MTWHVYTDGCALTDAARGRGQRHPGGWAAIVENGLTLDRVAQRSAGYVLRGRQAATTNTRMEIVAVVRALRSLEERSAVVVHTDCSAVFRVHERHGRGHLPGLRPSGGRVRDYDLWVELAGELDRMAETEVRFIPRGGNVIHRRAHAIAAAEAKALVRGLAPEVTILAEWERKQMVAERLRGLRGHGVEDALGDALDRRRRRLP